MRQVAQFVYPGSGVPTGMCWDGQRWVFLQQGGTAAVVSPRGTLIKTLTPRIVEVLTPRLVKVITPKLIGTE